MREEEGGLAGFPALPVARVAQTDDHLGFLLEQVGAEVEEGFHFADGERGRGDSGPEAAFEGFVVFDLIAEGGEGAGDGGAAGEVGFAGLGGGFLFDDEAVLLLLLLGCFCFGGLADGEGAEEFAEEMEGVVAEVGRRICTHCVEEPAEYGIVLAHTHFEKIGEGVEAEVIGGAVTGVLDEVGRSGMDDTGHGKDSRAVQGCFGEDVVERRKPFVCASVSVYFFEARVVEAYIISIVLGECKLIV